LSVEVWSSLTANFDAAPGGESRGEEECCTGAGAGVGTIVGAGVGARGEN